NTLGFVNHASTHPMVCVRPGWSPTKYGFLISAIRFLHSVPSASLMHASIGKSTGIKFPSTSSLRRFHAALEGQSASDGRRRRRGLLAKRQGGSSGRNAARPDLFKNVLRSMTLKSSLTQRKRVLTKVPRFCHSERITGNPSVIAGKGRVADYYRPETAPCGTSDQQICVATKIGFWLV